MNDKMSKDRSSIPPERIERSILLIRGQKVMLSTDLAELYQVEPRVLVQAMKRNIARFPQDFMFQLTEEEFSNLKSQIVISSWGGLRRARPYAFTPLERIDLQPALSLRNRTFISAINGQTF